jgi:hypothetical protein
VDRIGKSITGEIQLDLTHFPVDPARASLVAQEVNDATGSGLLLPTGLSGVTCDVNSSSDTSVPAESFTDGSFPDYGSEVDNRDYSCDGIAAIQFSFEPSGTNQTWYNARNDGAFIDANGRSGYLWRYYYPVGSNTEVFQGTGPGEVRSVRNTGCGGDGNGGQLAGNSLDGFAGGGSDPTGDNPGDGLDEQYAPTPIGQFITAPVPGGSLGVPPEGVCPGAVITRTIGNLDEQGNVTQSISQVVDDYSIPLTPPAELGGDNYNNKYIGFSVRCPDGSEQAIDPIVEPCTPSWNNPGAQTAEFGQTGTAVITGSYTVTNYITNCASGAVAVNTNDTYQFTQSVSNIDKLTLTASPTSFSSGCGQSNSLIFPGQLLIQGFLNNTLVFSQQIGTAGSVNSGPDFSQSFNATASVGDVTFSGSPVRPSSC